MSNTVKTKSGRTLILPTPEEEAAIQRGIDADPDTYELTSEEIAEMIPDAEFHAKRGRGRPKLDVIKQQVSMRFDADLLDALRASGSGWQKVVNDTMRRAMKLKPLKAKQ